MSYYNRNSHRRQSRPPRVITPGRVERVNARPGDCRYCGEIVAASAGQLWREESGAWSVVHTVAEWSGSPVSGRYIGGCPDDTDAQNERGGWGGRPERDRLAAIAATYAATHAPRPGRPGR